MTNKKLKVKNIYSKEYFSFECVKFMRPLLELKIKNE